MARDYYLDASALVKRYAVEAGSPQVNHLFQRLSPDRLICIGLGVLEVVSILVRKKNSNRLSRPVFAKALLNFQTEVVNASVFRKMPATAVLIDAALPLIPKHSINATDGLVLRSALDVASQLRVGGDDLVLITSDQRLLRAAQAEGLNTFDPETQTQAELDSLIGP